MIEESGRVKTIVNDVSKPINFIQHAFDSYTNTKFPAWMILLLSERHENQELGELLNNKGLIRLSIDMTVGLRQSYLYMFDKEQPIDFNKMYKDAFIPSETHIYSEEEKEIIDKAKKEPQTTPELIPFKEYPIETFKPRVFSKEEKERIDKFEKELQTIDIKKCRERVDKLSEDVFHKYLETHKPDKDQWLVFDCGEFIGSFQNENEVEKALYKC